MDHLSRETTVANFRHHLLFLPCFFPAASLLWSQVGPKRPPGRRDVDVLVLGSSSLAFRRPLHYVEVNVASRGRLMIRSLDELRDRGDMAVQLPASPVERQISHGKYSKP